jgi:periplasmic protein TonB
MFAESMLETTWAQRTRRSWTTLTSFGIQAVLLGILISIPLLTKVGIPLARTVSTPISLSRPDPGPIPTTAHYHSSGVEIVAYSGRIMAPGRIPRTIVRGGDDAAPSGPYLGPAGPGGVSFPFNPGGDIPLPISGTHSIPPAPVATKPTFRTSSMLQGSLIRRVEPVYPPLARSARIQGPVVLEAVISKGGTIENLQLISGHPMLVHAAIDAVKQWRYRPYNLNGEAIEVETQITVNFVLAN